MLRSHKIGEIDETHVGKRVELCGWVDTIREHGSLIFIDLRDRYGKVQAVISKKKEDFSKVKELSVESCIKIVGEVKLRPEGTINEELKSGKVEVSIEKVHVFNKCLVLPFQINDENVSEEVRLNKRFLDLRSEKMKKSLLLRSDLTLNVLDFFRKEGFVYLETPILGKSTPEGARDFIVPSRKQPGNFYALPQSPQLFKQLSQISGFDKYIQIARCFRDEDSRKDRQPEFTQIDVEMSFIEQEDIMNLLEKMMVYVFKETLSVELKTPFKRISYDEAMKKYGRDNPDLREETGEKFSFCWVVDFPTFEWNEEEKRYKSVHHPFTQPKPEEFYSDSPEKAKSFAYDLVLNGSEIGGGSIRISNPEMQRKVFDLLKISSEEAERKFGFLLDALSYGAPPHGGFAFGLDRLAQIMAGRENIREVIAFPKNSEGRDLMLRAPSEVSKDQLKEVSIKVEEKKSLKS
jgi:aspartyl-tRNA synthetase